MAGVSPLLLLCLGLVFFTTDNPAQANLEVWVTDSTRQYELQNTVTINPSTKVKRKRAWYSSVLRVDKTNTRQGIKGFGAAITNAAAYNIHGSSNANNIKQALFDPKNGIGISYIRLTLGGSDFQAVPPYSYNDLPSGQTDLDQTHFSIDKDRSFIIPLLKSLKSINPSLKIMGTPWSAPGWMKSTGQLNGGSLKDSQDIRISFGMYLQKIILAYEAEGLPLDTMTIQNEPHHSGNDYPSMYMSADVQKELMAHHIGPRFQSNGIATQLLAWDHNWDNTDFALGVLNDDHTRKHVAGSAWHCYGPQDDYRKPGDVWRAHPDKDIYFSECSGGYWATDFWGNIVWNMQRIFLGQIANGARTVLLWNMALDENHGPKVGVGGCSNCRGVITVKKDGTFVKNEEYFLIGHFSKFIPPGSRVLDTGSPPQGLEYVGFVKPDGKAVLVVMNTKSSSQAFAVETDSNTVYKGITLPPRSIATLVEV